GEESVEQLEASCGALRHGNGDGAIQLDNRRWSKRCKLRVERGDLRPIGFFRRMSAGVAGNDGSLQNVGTRYSSLPGAIKRGEAPANQELIPERAVLIEQKNWLPFGRRPRRETRRLNFHERDKPMNFGFFGREFGEHAPEAQSVIAEVGPHPIASRSCRVAFVENQVDDFENRRKARGPFFFFGHFERDFCIGERTFGADNALRDCWFRDEISTSDFGCS